MRQLPEPYRGALLRRYYEGKSAGEIARETGASAATVRSQLARGLERLRHDFEKGHADTSLHSAGALSLLLLAAGSTRGTLSRASLEIIAMKTSTKVAIASAFVAVTLIASRGFLVPAPSNADVERNTTVLPDSSRDGDAPDADLAEIGGEAGREGLADVVLRTGSAEDESGADAIGEDGSAPAVSIVRARMVDEGGKALEGIEFRSIYSDGRPRGEDCHAISDTSGICEIAIEDRFMRAFRTEVHPMSFQASGRFRATVFVVSTPRWRGTTDLGDVEMPRGGAITGTVVDSSGRPLAGAKVIIGDPVMVKRLDGFQLKGPDRRTRRPRTIAGDSGAFEFPGARSGSVRLYVGMEGKLWTVTDTIDVAERSTSDVGRIILDEIPDDELIAGVVRRPDGTPAPGAKVSYESADMQTEGTLTSDAWGRFSFSPAGSGAVEFLARDPEDVFGMSSPGVAARGSDDVVLELNIRRVIELTVTDEDGDPIGKAAVMPIFTDRDLFANGGRPIPGTDRAYTSELGVVEIGVPSAGFRVSVSRTGFESQSFGPYEPETAPAALKVELKSEPHIAGRVLAYGEPVHGASILIGQRISDFVMIAAGFPNRLFNQQNAEVETDAEGRFECPVDPEWTDVSVLAFRDGLAAGELELTLEAGEGAEKIVVEVTDGGVVKGSVLAPAGIDVGDLFVAASRGDCRPLWTRVQADGTYELAGMTPGSWHVEGRLKEPAVTTIAIAQTPEEKEYNWNVEVVDRRDVTFDIDMRGQGDVALHGRFLIDGEPAEGWRVMLQRKDDRYSGDAVPAAVVDESGGFVLSTRAGRAELTLLGELEGGARVEFVRIIELEGTRVDWEGEITTGPISETWRPASRRCGFSSVRGGAATGPRRTSRRTRRGASRGARPSAPATSSTR